MDETRPVREPATPLASASPGTAQQTGPTVVPIGHPTENSIEHPIEHPMDMPPGAMELRFTPELLVEIEAELAEVESAIETLQLDRGVAR